MKHLKKLSLTLALLITAVTGAWAQDTYTVAGSNPAMFGSSWDPTNTANDMTKNGDGTYSITYTNVSLDGNVQYKVVKNHSWDEAYPATDRVITIAEAGTYTVTIHFNPTTHEVYETMPDPNAIEVTLNDTKTEASFEMPTNDVDVSYELVRDMSVQMTATMGDGSDGVRYRVKKAQQGEGYEPADMEMAAVPALFTVNDAIEQKALTQTQDYIVQIYSIDAEGQPTGDPMTFATFTFAPGIYAVKAVAADGSAYDGETALSNTFKLFQGYEITVPAGEFVTYYKDEALYVEDTDAKLYTITAVSGDKATATELTTAAANTPLLVKNNAETEKVILLIPTTEQTPDNVSPYEGFKGTLEGTQIAASTDTQANYVCTGKQFTWVKDAGTIAANRCWLELVSSTSAPVLDIVFSNATGVKEVKEVIEVNDGSWYDLNGRKLQAKPTTKGVYILNGRKVVVK